MQAESPSPARLPTAEPLWRGLTREDICRQFDMRVAVPNGQTYTEERARRSVTARELLPGLRDVRYGEGPRQLVDIYPGVADGPIVVFFHGGAWRYQSKDAFAYLAEPLVARGITTVIPGYDLVPVATLPQMMRQAQEALAWTCKTLSPEASRRVVVVGHSAGAQLAGMALAHDYRNEGLSRSVAHASLLISGSYDMEPHRYHDRYTDLCLSDEMIQKSSPARNPPLDSGVDMVIAVGSDETPGYQIQAREYRDALDARGHRARLMECPGDHHFSVVGRLGEANHALTKTLVTLALGDEYEKP